MTRTVYIDGAKVALAPAALLGQGGEAEVYDLGDGRVLKWWKPADHPDFDGMPAAQQAARERIAAAPARLRALPGNLPAAVVAPCGLALDRHKHVVGYLMPKVAGTPLHAYGEPRWRRDNPVAGADVIAALLALHDAIGALHRADIVIGDCNDLNVLVDLPSAPLRGAARPSEAGACGGTRVHLIDVDSYQLPGFPCAMFSERFVDPRLCDGQLVPVRPHDRASDWFAFAVMAFRALVQVSPWGGVQASCPASQRALKRVSVMAPGVVYPRASRPLATLPDETLDAFRAIFERDVRDVPRDLLARIQLRKCAACGDEHARVRCPSCAAPLPLTVVHGRLRYAPISGVQLPGFELSATTRPVWLAGDALMRETRLGPERIGSVLAGQTRAWCGTRLGIGFYRAGGYAVGFTFRPERGVLDDRLQLPKLRGRIVDAHAVVGEDRAWLFVVTEAGTHVIVVDGGVTIAGELVDSAWLAGLYGAVAAGPHLFVPTDDGVARVEVVQGTIAQTRVFAETASLVTAGDRLALHPGGLDVVRRRDAIRMHLT